MATCHQTYTYLHNFYADVSLVGTPWFNGNKILIWKLILIMKVMASIWDIILNWHTALVEIHLKRCGKNSVAFGRILFSAVVIIWYCNNERQKKCLCLIISNLSNFFWTGYQQLNIYNWYLLILEKEKKRKRQYLIHRYFCTEKLCAMTFKLIKCLWKLNKFELAAKTSFHLWILKMYVLHLKTRTATVCLQKKALTCYFLIAVMAILLLAFSCSNMNRF